MNESTYWLWNGKDMEGPFTRASLIEKTAQGFIMPEAKIMDTQGEGWRPVGEVLAPVNAVSGGRNPEVAKLPMRGEKDRPLFGFIPPAISNVIAAMVVGLFAIAGAVKGFQTLTTASPVLQDNAAPDVGTSLAEPGSSQQSQDAIRLNHAIQSMKAGHRQESIWGYLWTGVILCGIVYALPKLEIVYVRWCLQMGDKRLHRGNYRQAIRYYDTALRADSENAMAYYQRGLANLKLGNIELAQSDWDEAHGRNSSLSPYA